jgi:hypothetical protein
MKFVTQGKANWKYILIVVILSIIVGGGILWWINQQDFSIEFTGIKKPEEVENETANWNIYRIGDFPCEYIGYEIKYPPDLVVEGWEEETLERCPAATSHSVSFIKIKDSKRIVILRITTHGDPLQLMYKSWEEGDAVPVKINEIGGLKIDEGTFVLPKSEKYYFITGGSESGVKDLFNQMLSTFKFLE